MSTKTTTKKSIGADSATSKNSTKVVTNKAGKVTGVTIVDVAENAGPSASEKATEQPIQVVATTKVESKPKAKTEKKVAASKSAKPVTKKDVAVGKELSIGGRKIKLAATCYHYYRNWLKEFMRSHGVGSARFSKAPDSYKGHITCLETDRARGLKALETWNKENPDTKELFWDVKK